MEEIRHELLLKLKDLNTFVERSAKELLGSATLFQDVEHGVENTNEEKSVAEKMEILNILPDWLESVRQSLREFTDIAKCLKPIKKEPVKLSASELFPDPDAHQCRLAEFREHQAEKLRKRATVALLESRLAVRNLVDSAVVIGQSDGTGCEKLVKEEGCFLFGRGFPVEAISERLEDLLDEKWTMARIPQRLNKEAERQLALNESGVDEYVAARGGNSSLGHVIHRILAIKYPRPPVPAGKCLPRQQVMSLLLGIEDQEVLASISKLMADVKVKLVHVQDALEFCVDAYRKEGPGLPLLESKDPPPNPTLPEAVTAAALLMPYAFQKELKALEPPPKQKEIETQTGPEVAPNLSMEASLGKQALETLRLKEPLTDWLITAMVIEYLKQLVAEKILGWTLVNFPSTFEQVRLFEAAISGQWVPNPDNPREEQGGCYTLVQSKIIADPSDPVQAVMPFCTIFTSVVAVSGTDPALYVPLVNEVYLRQNVLACFHCSKFEEDKIRSVAELLLRSSPNPPVALPAFPECLFPDLEIPLDLALGMTALWEAVETAFLGRLHRITLANRIWSNLSLRYLTTIKKKFKRFLGRDSKMQLTVNLFVERYNEVPRPWDEDSVSEMRNRVENLAETIVGQVEERRQEADVEMRVIAEQSWLGRQLVEKLQTIAAVAQLELDRFVDTAALVQDFCSASLGKVPPDATKSLRFEVPKVFGEEISDEWTGSLADIVLANELPEKILPEAFDTYNVSVLESASTYVNKLSDGVKKEIGKFETELKPKPQKNKGKAPAKGKKTKGPTIDDVPNLEDLELNKINTKKQQLLSEWREMLEKEAELTLNSVEREILKQTSEAENLIKRLWSSGFQLMRSTADAQRNSDCQSMQELKEFLDSAVEAATVLKPPICIPLKTIYTHYLQGPNAPVPTVRPKNFCEGLRDLLDVLKRLAPDGRILLSGLTYLLCQSAAAGKHLPLEWAQLSKKQVEKVLLGHLNGKNVVDWRALIVGLMELPVANQRQLVIAAKRLKTGTREVFCKSPLWFDSVFDDEETAEVKELLYEVYKLGDKDKAAALELLSVAAYDADPMAGFFKCCALHQGDVLEKEQMLGDVTLSDIVLLESAVSACQAVMPTQDETTAPRLQQIWNEAEEMSLDDEQRRSRNRATAAGKYVAADASHAAVALLKDYEPLVELAHEYFGKQKLSRLIDIVLHT